MEYNPIRRFHVRYWTAANSIARITVEADDATVDYDRGATFYKRGEKVQEISGRIIALNIAPLDEVG